MINEEKSDVFNILDWTIKQTVPKSLDVGKTPLNVAECSNNLYFLIKNDLELHCSH